MEHISQFKALSSAEKNDLPDSAFAIILPGGKKDDSGRTIPRSLRKLPIHDKEHALAAKQVLEGARGGVKLPPAIKQKALKKVNAKLKEFNFAPVGKKTERKAKMGAIKETTDADEVSRISRFAQMIDFNIYHKDPVGLDEKTSKKLQEIPKILKFNDELIQTLEEAKKEQDSLKQLLLEKDVLLKQKNAEIEQIQEAIKQEKQIQFNNKLNHIAEQWCSTFGAKAEDKNDVLKLLAEFKSEANLEKVSTYLNRLKGNSSKEDTEVLTRPSSVIQEQKNVQKSYDQMSYEERMDMLFQQMHKV